MKQGISSKIKQMTRKVVISFILKGSKAKDDLNAVTDLLIFLNPEDAELLSQVKESFKNNEVHKCVGYLAEYSRRKLKQLSFE